MTDNITRLGEARKQIQIVSEKLEDEGVVEDLQKAEILLETVEGKIAECSEEP